MRPATRVALAFTTLMALALFERPAAALPPGIYVTPEAIDTSAAGFEKTLVKARTSQVPQVLGKWHFYFVAYLNKPSPSDQLNIVFYDAKVKGKQEPNAFPLTSRKGAKILSSESTVSPEDGIKPGPFNVRITMLDKGKEVIFASTRIELKPPAPEAK